MSRASPARRYRKAIERKRHSSSAVQSVRPKDPKPYEEVPVEYAGKIYFNGSEAVKPAAPGVRIHVSIALELARMGVPS